MARRKSGQGGAQPYQRPDGLWCGSVSLGKHPDGRRNRPSVYGQTAAEVRAKMRDLEAKHRAGLPTKPDNTTIRDLLVLWLETVVKVEKRPKTLAAYEYVCRLYLVPNLGNIRVRDLSAQHVLGMMAYARSAGLSTASVAQCRTILSIAIHQAEKWDMVSRNVVSLTTPPKVEKARAPDYEEGTAQAILKVLRTHPLGDLFALQMLTGMRISEVIGVCTSALVYDASGLPVRLEVRHQLQYIAVEEGSPRVPCFTPTKSARGRRPVPLGKLAQEVVLRAIERLESQARVYAAHDEAGTLPVSAGSLSVEEVRARRAWADSVGLLFRSELGTPLNSDNVRRVWSQMRKEAGVDWSTHGLRHLWVSAMLRQGIPPSDVAMLAGHSGMGTMYRVYGHLLPDALPAAASAIDSAFGEGGEGDG